ncbi:hypothetical protein J6590_090988 [Homalodisca vitripennis]|nr:hypothetical protein J6590_090988 [Homalodisca vitripennis]
MDETSSSMVKSKLSHNFIPKIVSLEFEQNMDIDPGLGPSKCYDLGFSFTTSKLWTPCKDPDLEFILPYRILTGECFDPLTPILVYFGNRYVTYKTFFSTQSTGWRTKIPNQLWTN